MFTANPFALKEVAGEKDSGDVDLGKGQSITLRHRIIFHAGDEKTAEIAEAWKAYAVREHWTDYIFLSRGTSDMARTTRRQFFQTSAVVSGAFFIGGTKASGGVSVLTNESALL